MPTREAACSCGQLCLTAEGDPFAISICHCLACQRRTGSAFGMGTQDSDFDPIRDEPAFKKLVER